MESLKLKKHLAEGLILMGLFLSHVGMAQKSSSIDSLFFENGQFKIAQFTDLHWDPVSPNRKQTAALIARILETEKPNIAIVTGDIVTSFPADQGWNEVAEIFEKSKMPWAITLGNHDEEVGMGRREIFQLLEGKPYFMGEVGPEISGGGNYVIPMYSHKDKNIAALMYFMDTHNRPSANFYGRYNWVQQDQINWFRQQSEQFTKINHGIPYPALAFIHIPLLEYRQLHEKGPVLGNKTEVVSPSELNSGLFTSFVDKVDVMGVFAGHDHDNDYIGQHFGIALAYGRTTGTDAEGVREKGARIIQLYEGQHRFDTWLRTLKAVEYKYYYPSGVSDEDENKMSFKEAVSIKNPTSGLKYSYYEGGKFEKVQDIYKHGALRKSGIVENINLDLRVARDSFAFVFEGLISIPEDAVYNFYTFSDDGSKLFIDDEIVVDNDGSRDITRKDGKIALKKGFHKFKLEYFDDYMGELLEVGISSRNMKEQTIPARMFFYRRDK